MATRRQTFHSATDKYRTSQLFLNPSTTTSLCDLEPKMSNMLAFAYSRPPPPPPKMPPGLRELMEELTREVLRHGPEDVHGFCASHMKKLLEIRDGPRKMRPLRLEEKQAKAQKIVRYRAELRIKKFDRENTVKKYDTEGESIKAPVFTENYLKEGLELELFDKDSKIFEHLTLIKQEDIKIVNNPQEEETKETISNLTKSICESRHVEQNGSVDHILSYNLESEPLLLKTDEVNVTELQTIQESCQTEKTDNKTEEHIKAQNKNIYNTEQCDVIKETEPNPTEGKNALKENSNILDCEPNDHAKLVQVIKNNDTDATASTETVEASNMETIIPKLEEVSSNTNVEKFKKLISNNREENQNAGRMDEDKDLKDKELLASDNVQTVVESSGMNEELQAGNNVQSVIKSPAINEELIAGDNVQTVMKSPVMNEELIAGDNVKTFMESPGVNKELLEGDNVQTVMRSPVMNEELIGGDNVQTVMESPVLNEELIAGDNLKTVMESPGVNKEILAGDNVQTVMESPGVNEELLAGDNVHTVMKSPIMNEELIAGVYVKTVMESPVMNEELIAGDNVKTVKESSAMIEHLLAGDNVQAVMERPVLNGELIAGDNVKTVVESTAINEQLLTGDNFKTVMESPDMNKETAVVDKKGELVTFLENSSCDFEDPSSLAANDQIVSGIPAIEQLKVEVGSTSTENFTNTPVTDINDKETTTDAVNEQNETVDLTNANDDLARDDNKEKDYQEPKTKTEAGNPVDEQETFSSDSKADGKDNEKFFSTENIKSDVSSSNDDTLNETLSGDESLNISQSTMDLETAAVTIQKVFRSFLFKSRNSTFDDAASDESTIDKDNMKEPFQEEPDFMSHNDINKERRTLGLSRMDSTLQTVNEEKSLSLSTDDSSTLSSAATTIQAHVRGFLVRNKMSSEKTTSTNSFGNSHPSESTDIPEQVKSKTVLNIHIVPESGNYVSRDDSLLASMDLSMDGSPRASSNLHPLGYDKSERRKQLKREDAIQSVSPPSNNSGKLSEDVDSVKEMPLTDVDAMRQTSADTLVNKDDPKLNVDSRETTPTLSVTNDTVKTAIEIKRDQSLSETKNDNISKVDLDESDVVTPCQDDTSLGSSDSKLLHSGEFHDGVLPTKVSRNDSVIREFKNVLVFFLLWK